MWQRIRKAVQTLRDIRFIELLKKIVSDLYEIATSSGSTVLRCVAIPAVLLLSAFLLVILILKNILTLFARYWRLIAAEMRCHTKYFAMRSANWVRAWHELLMAITEWARYLWNKIVDNSTRFDSPYKGRHLAVFGAIPITTALWLWGAVRFACAVGWAAATYGGLVYVPAFEHSATGHLILAILSATVIPFIHRMIRVGHLQNDGADVS